MWRDLIKNTQTYLSKLRCLDFSTMLKDIFDFLFDLFLQSITQQLYPNLGVFLSFQAVVFKIYAATQAVLWPVVTFFTCISFGGATPSFV